MRKVLFEDLLLSLKQAKAISRGELEAGRRTVRIKQMSQDVIAPKLPASSTHQAAAAK